jgi:peptidoglycan L-alanyl-D-glutamate endopeptidase CwlK
MYSFGEKSKERLNTCHIDLRTICNEVIKYIDFSILEGTRSLAKQQEYFNAGKSKLDGITQKSKHQRTPSLAIDIMPYTKGTNPFDGDNKSKARFYLLAGYMLMASEQLYDRGDIQYKLRWGGDWDSDKNFSDQSFDDLPHFELI